MHCWVIWRVLTWVLRSQQMRYNCNVPVRHVRDLQMKRLLSASFRRRPFFWSSLNAPKRRWNSPRTLYL